MHWVHCQTLFNRFAVPGSATYCQLLASKMLGLNFGWKTQSGSMECYRFTLTLRCKQSSKESAHDCPFSASPTYYQPKEPQHIHPVCRNGSPWQYFKANATHSNQPGCFCCTLAALQHFGLYCLTTLICGVERRGRQSNIS